MEIYQIDLRNFQGKEEAQILKDLYQNINKSLVEFCKIIFIKFDDDQDRNLQVEL